MLLRPEALEPGGQTEEIRELPGHMVGEGRQWESHEAVSHLYLQDILCPNKEAMWKLLTRGQSGCQRQEQMAAGGWGSCQSASP